MELSIYKGQGSQLTIYIQMPSMTYPESPKTKHNDDEVHCICEEHQHIYISHSTVVWMNKIVEKLSDRHIHLESPKTTMITM